MLFDLKGGTIVSIVINKIPICKNEDYLTSGVLIGQSLGELLF